MIRGQAQPEGYLAGDGPLGEMERDLVLLRQEPHFQVLFFNPGKAASLRSLVPEMAAFLAGEEALLEAEAGRFNTAEMEIITGRLILLKDVLWGLERDILANIEKILHLADAAQVGELTPESFSKYARINFLLNCIDRLEVRGRDSAGIQGSLTLEDRSAMDRILEQLRGEGLHGEFARRSVERDLLNGSILAADTRNPDGTVWLSFVYKTASIIGKLGENVRRLREAIRADASSGPSRGRPPSRSRRSPTPGGPRWAPSPRRTATPSAATPSARRERAGRSRRRACAPSPRPSPQHSPTPSRRA